MFTDDIIELEVEIVGDTISARSCVKVGFLKDFKNFCIIRCLDQSQVVFISEYGTDLIEESILCGGIKKNFLL